MGPYFTPSARTVMDKRYLRKDEQGRVIEEPSDMFRRVADNIASADAVFGASPEEIKKSADEFYNMQVNLEFLSGMALRNAGRELQQLSACYVLPIGDSMDSIYTTLKNAAKLHKTGAGIGYDFSTLRPRGAVVSTTGGKSSGPVSFMRLFDFSCRTIVNNAATRRAGNMGILRVDHPDIFEFISAKDDNTQLNNFNASVAMTDEFMEAVKRDGPFNLVDPHTKEVAKTIQARELFNLIAEHAWTSAEPGIVFIDEINRNNPTPHVGRMDSTNQCGEQPLLPYENCNLGSINLSKVVKGAQTGGKSIDFDKLRDLITKAVRFLDNTVEINHYPLPEIEKLVKFGNRKIGLGVMGFADMLIEIGVPYNSQKALDVAEEIMKFIQEEGHKASIELGKKRGSFPNFKGSIWEQKGYPTMRNATVTTIAPTGTTSILANCSSGVEPIFSLVFIRKNFLDIGTDEFIEVHPIFEKMAKDRWFYTRELMEEVASRGSVQGIKGVPEDIQKIFITAYDTASEWQVMQQAVFQKYTDNAVSKTVNLPHTATIEDVKRIYQLAYETHCKGITVYRDGSRHEQVLNLKKIDEKVKTSSI